MLASYDGGASSPEEDLDEAVVCFDVPAAAPPGPPPCNGVSPWKLALPKLLFPNALPKLFTGFMELEFDGARELVLECVLAFVLAGEWSALALLA